MNIRLIGDGCKMEGLDEAQKSGKVEKGERRELEGLREERRNTKMEF